MAPKPIPAEIRFSAKWRLDEATGCHVWTAATVGSGYGCFYVSHAGRQLLAHRVSYEMAKGPIPTGLHVDHLCRNKLCVNPAHLEAVSQRENSRRVPWKKRDACIRGHELTAENTYTRPSTGARRCRECAKMAANAGAKRRYVPRQDMTFGNPPAGLLSLAFS